MKKKPIKEIIFVVPKEAPVERPIPVPERELEPAK
jgi:hypothetical protein